MTEPTNFDQQMQSLQASFADAHPFDSAEVRLEPSGLHLRVLMASTLEQRARGLIGQDLTGHDAMVFVQPVVSPATFHMQGLDQSLDLAWFDTNAIFMGSLRMQAGSDLYPIPAFKYALEISPNKITFQKGDYLILP